MLYGSSSGVTTVDDLYYQSLGGVNGLAEAGDHFGGALAAGNFNGDSDSGHACDDLAIGVPDEAIGTIASAGYLYVVYSAGTSGLSTTGDFAVHQDASGAEGTAEQDDRFALRLRIIDDDGDAYDDLEVTVPGDACTPGGVGLHVFPGASGGLGTSNDRLECGTYQCQIEGGAFGCPSYSPAVYGTDAGEQIVMFAGDDVVFAGAGNDVIAGDRGNDVLFGGDGADALDGGLGLDVQIGGAGNDTFTIDADCEAVAGEIIDGGPGTDTVESHLSRTQLVALGVTFVSIETFTTISEHPYPETHCTLGPYEEGPPKTPVIALTWDDLPNETSEFSTTTGLIDLFVESSASSTVTVDISFTLRVRGEALRIVEAPFNLTPTNPSTTVTLDLGDFVPSGYNPGAGDPTIFSSAWIDTRAELNLGTTHAGYAHAPTLYGHTEALVSGGYEVVLYRAAAHDRTYNAGDLTHGAPDENPWSEEDGGDGKHLNVVEAFGTVCTPSE